MITYHSLLGLPFCTHVKCRHAIGLQGVSRHLRDSHQHTATVSSEIQKDLERRQHEEARARPPASNSLASERAKYILTTNKDISAGVHPPIPEFPLMDAFQCPKCEYIAPAIETVRKHMGTHRCSPSSECSDNFRPVKAQSVFGGNKSRYFEVVNPEDNRKCRLSEVMTSIEGSKPSHFETDVSRMDAYLSEMRFDRHLARMKITSQQAFEMTKWKQNDDTSKLRKLLAAYFKKAFDLTEIHVHIRAHRFLEGNLQLALHKETLHRYLSSSVRFLSFLLDACKQSQQSKVIKYIPDDVVLKINDLARTFHTVNDQTLLLLHHIIYPLLFSPLKQKQAAFPVFITCSSVIGSGRNNNLRYVKASEFSPMLAALKYLARVSVVTEVYASDEERDTRWELVEKATKHTADTGLTYLTHCMKVSNRLRPGETHNIRFIVCPTHPLCGILDGHELPIRTLGAKMKELQRNAWSLLTNDILGDLHITQQFWQACSTLQDVLCDRTPGYWFGMHSANHDFLKFWRKRLLDKLRPVLLGADDNLKEKEATQFLNKCQQLQAMLYGLLQVCSGAPARATEIGVLQVCNTQTASRHLFVSNGQLLVALYYHKCRSTQEGVGKPIVRFPDAVTAGLLMVYLFIVRPLETAIIYDMNLHAHDYTEQENRSTRSRDFLFTDHGTCASPEQLRNWFEKCMKKVSIPFSTSQYRQYHGGVVKNFLSSVDSVGRLDPSTTLHLQTGHTERTAHTIYGVSSLDMQNLTGTEMEAYRGASETWHKAIGLVHGQPRGLDPNVESQDLPQDLPQEVLPPSTVHDEAASRASCCANQIVTDLAQMQATMSCILEFVQTLPGMEPLIGAKRKHASLQSADLSPIAKKRSQASSEPSSGSITKSLRLFLTNPGAEFRSREQQEAVTHAVMESRDALIVLPTGGGKSMAFMLPAYIFPAKVCVIVVPLVALQDDFARRCALAGLHAAKWTERHTAGARIILVSAEHIVSQEYQSFMREMHVTGRLHAIFIDEGHLVVLWSDFRTVLTQLARKIRPSGVDCPVFTLTATSPPSATSKIGTACGMKDWFTFRSRTTRQNIRYSVRDVDENNLNFLLLNIVQRIVLQYPSSETKLIIFSQTRDGSDNLVQALRLVAPNAPCFGYHAALPEEQKRDQHRAWEDSSDGMPHVMVATSAFGCGIDVSTVRAVIHVGRPRTLIEYLQESGRAGRDNNPAESIVLNIQTPSWKDTMAADRQSPSPVQSSHIFGDTNGLTENSDSCRRWLLDLFADGELQTETCHERGMESCDVCSSPVLSSSSSPPAVVVGTAGVIGIQATPAPEPHLMGTPPTPTTGNSGTSGHSSSSATPDEMVTLCDDIGRGCPVCSLKTGRVVSHDKPTCFVGRCLRCGGRGHGAKNCTNIWKRKDESGCRSCTISYYLGQMIHKDGTYGGFTCGFKKIIAMSVIAFEEPEWKSMMQKHLPQTRQFTNTQTYASWLRGKLDKNVLGLAIVGPWIRDNLLSNH